MADKLALVTGVTSGIGREVALGLVGLGYDLIIIARNEAKVEELRRDAVAVRPNAKLDYHFADLSLVASTREALSEITTRIDRIDLLYFSAALVPSQPTITSEGIERCFAISYLSRVVITDAMLPALLKGEDRTLIAIASPGMKAKVDFDDVNFETRPYKTMDVLGQFQHANDVYFTHLAEVHEGDGLRAFVYHPGVVDTPIHQNWSGFVGFVMRVLMRPMMISAKRSAQYPLQLFGGTFTPTTGMFNHKGKSLPVPAGVRDATYRQRVVDFSRDLIRRASGTQESAV